MGQHLCWDVQDDWHPNSTSWRKGWNFKPNWNRSSGGNSFLGPILFMTQSPSCEMLWALSYQTKTDSCNMPVPSSSNLRWRHWGLGIFWKGCIDSSRVINSLYQWTILLSFADSKCVIDHITWLVFIHGSTCWTALTTFHRSAKTMCLCSDRCNAYSTPPMSVWFTNIIRHDPTQSNPPIFGADQLLFEDTLKGWHFIWRPLLVDDDWMWVHPPMQDASVSQIQSNWGFLWIVLLLEYLVVQLIGDLPWNLDRKGPERSWGKSACRMPGFSWGDSIRSPPPCSVAKKETCGIFRVSLSLEQKHPERSSLLPQMSSITPESDIQQTMYQKTARFSHWMEVFISWG